MKPLEEPLEIAVIGANPDGRGGEWISRIREMADVWRLSAVVDPSPVVRQAWRQEGVQGFSSVEELLESALANPRGAVVAVPPAHAVKVERSCLRAGIGILAEKPMGASLAELVELQELLPSLERPVLLPGVQRRSHPAYRSLRAVVEGRKPDTLSVKICLGRSPAEIPAGHRGDIALCRGGVLLDLGYHALDLVHFLLGTPLEVVSCQLEQDGDLGTNLESAARVFGRAGQTWVRLEVTRCGPSKSETVEMRTGDGVWLANRSQVVCPDGSVHCETDPSWDSAERDCLDRLALAVRGKGERPAADLWEHLATFAVVEQAYAQARILGLEGTRQCHP